LDGTKLLIIDGWGGFPTERGHAAPDLTVRLLQGFADRFDLSVALLGPVPGEYRRTLPPHCHVSYLPPYSSKWDYIRVRARTRRVLDELIRRSDLALVRLPSFHGVDAIAVGGGTPVPVVCFILGVWEEAIGDRHVIYKRVYSRAARWMTRRTAAKADLVLTQGTHLSRYLKRLGVDSLPVIESPLEPEDFVSRDPQNGAWPPGPLRVLAISRLAPMKNLHALINAVHQVRAVGIGVHLKVVGGGELLGELLEQRRRLGLSDCVEFLGRLDDRPALRAMLSSADVFVLPSLGGEGVSLSVLEAMAAGLPIVAAPVGGITDILAGGDNAMLLKAPNAEEISRALISLAGDPQLRLDLGSAARDSARGLQHEVWVERFHEIVTQRVLKARQDRR
jgi:glycosyltransferase involved in cell wall biosynthesis